MSLPQVVDFSTESDADFVYDFNFGVDMTGSTLLLMARPYAAANYAPISLTSAGASPTITLTTAASGLGSFTIPLAQLSPLPAGDYVYSLIELTAAGLRIARQIGTITHAIGPTR